MKLNLSLVSYLALSLTAFGCKMGGGQGFTSGNNSLPVSPNTSALHVVSGQKDLDLTNTTFTLSSCSAGVTYISTPQPANNVQLPTPNAPTISCNITLTQLAYTDSNNDSFVYTPQVPPGLTGTVSINQSTGAFTVTAPSTTTATYIGTNTIYTGGGTVTSFVTFTVASNQIAINWNVNAPTNTTTLQTFSPTGGNGTSGNMGNAVPPRITFGRLLVNTTTNIVSMTLNFINNSGAADNTQTDQNDSTIFQAKTILNPNAGPQCYIFYDQVSATKPSWYNLNSTSTLTTATNFTTAQLNVGSNYGYYQPTSYAAANSLFQNAQTTVTKPGIAATGTINQFGYYVTSGSVILGYMNCYNIMNFSTTNWGGLGSTPYDSVTTTTTNPDFAKYAWFAVFANNLNNANVAQNANAYSVLIIPNVAGQ